MKIFSLLSCVSVVSAGFSDVSGELTVSSSGKQVVIEGDLSGLPKSIVDGGIHVHAGTDCTNSDNVGGHLFSSFTDGWLDTKYDTDGDGFASINVKGNGYKLNVEDNTAGQPAVEGRCIVLHGASADDTASRVAIGKIVKDGNSFSAIIKKYPGPNPLNSNPSGKLTVLAEGDSIRLTGAVTSLGKGLSGVGIHIHIGKDCTGGSDTSSKAAVNAVVGGHLLYRADGYLTTKYRSNAAGLGAISIKTPAAAGYTLLKKDATKGTPVEDHCIVIHSKTERVGIGKIVCDNGSCKAKMGPYPKKDVPLSGTLSVSFSNGVVTIKGDVRGLPRGSKDAGIHVHTGTDCTNNGFDSKYDILQHVGGHLYSDSVDGWAFPKPIAYDTNSAGEGEINVQAKQHVLAQSDDTDAKPAVEGHCIVLHGASPGDMGARVAIGKIVKNGEKFTATIGKYPGPASGLATVPSGTLTVTSPSTGIVALKGTLKGLGKGLKGAGIHIHTGTDCTGGSDKSSKAAVNAVVGGHLLSRDDAFAHTTYNTNVNGESSIYVTTPAKAYTLRKSQEIDGKVPAVENRCIIIHDSNAAVRVGIAQIKCPSDNGDCFAKVVPYPKPVGPISGELGVTYANGVVSIKGDLSGLFRETAEKEDLKKTAGIHVHAGTECDDKDAVGAHLYSNSMDSWAIPKKITYDTNNNGEASIVITVNGHTLAKEDGTAAIPAVEDHCVVLHGASVVDMASRVAIGKIVKNGNSFSATLGKYPGPNPLDTVPSGTINLTPAGTGAIQLAAINLKGLGKGLKGAGIHIHSGTDCTGGADKTSKDAVNKVVGGHLLSRADGFKTTTYKSSRLTTGSIDIKTPKGAYVLLTKNANANLPAVEGRCIVLHNPAGARVGVGKIVCDNGSCKANIGPYPTTKKTTTPKPTTPAPTPAPTTTTTEAPTTARDVVVDDNSVTKMFVSLSALLVYCFASF